MSESLWTEPIAVIQQGAQYYLPFRIRQNGTVLSPDNVDDVKIKVGDVTKQFSKGELTYTGETWMYQLKQEYTMRLVNDAKVQVSVRIGNNIYPSPLFKIHIGTSIIKDGF